MNLLSQETITAHPDLASRPRVDLPRSYFLVSVAASSVVKIQDLLS